MAPPRLLSGCARRACRSAAHAHWHNMVSICTLAPQLAALYRVYHPTETRFDDWLFGCCSVGDGARRGWSCDRGRPVSADTHANCAGWHSRKSAPHSSTSYILYTHSSCTCYASLPSALDTALSTAAQDYSLLEVRATSPGGHASMPPTDGSSVSQMQTTLVKPRQQLLAEQLVCSRAYACAGCCNPGPHNTCHRCDTATRQCAGDSSLGQHTHLYACSVLVRLLGVGHGLHECYGTVLAGSHHTLFAGTSRHSTTARHTLAVATCRQQATCPMHATSTISYSFAH
jgi:hypothetical protein